MAVDQKYADDVAAIMSHRHDLGWDLWTTPDKRLLKGAPFNTIECLGYLLDLGVDPAEPIMRQTTDLILSLWQDDGRFKVYPKGSVYPCQTAFVVAALCQAGLVGDERVQGTLRQLLDRQHEDFGWRCNRTPFGKEVYAVECSNPNTTLLALDAFRFSQYRDTEPALGRAVDSLLAHWDVKRPVGPCQYGIGTLFMQVEYPFRGYDLFKWVYVLSFYERARGDRRFLEALAALEGKLVDGQIVVERVVPKLAKLKFCAKGRPSERATERYQEIRRNLGR